MDVIRTIRPGKPGSCRFLKHWGERLVAVRYRKNPGSNKIYTTIEIIMDEREQAPAGISFNNLNAARRNEVVAVQINFEELELRNQAKHKGARWSRQLKMWLMRYNTAVTLGLQHRVVEGLAQRCTDVDISVDVL